MRCVAGDSKGAFFEGNDEYHIELRLSEDGKPTLVQRLCTKAHS
jgi:hypothetical protein